MKITVLNGSPKGDVSVTMQYFKYMEQNLTGCEFTVFNVGHEIKKIEKDHDRFERIIGEVSESDGVLWCFPVYILLVPSQLKRFIELVFENNNEDVFAGKYGAAITTSKHIYDHTAHNYVHSVSEDLGMRYFGGYSADTHDLLKTGDRDNILRFARNFIDSVENKRPVSRVFQQITYSIPEYLPGDIKKTGKTGKHKMVLLTDSVDADVNLNRMIDVFERSIPNEVEIINLADIDIRGGCLGCLRCGYDGICFYSDGMMDFYNEKLLPANAIVYAGTIRDRFLSSRWKMFFDRAFFNNHRQVLRGKQAAILISGPLRQMPNLREMLESYFQSGMVSIVDIVTDEYENSDDITSLLRNLSDRLLGAIDSGYQQSFTFLRAGGDAMLRDVVKHFRFVFNADHDYYKKHHFYESPQKYTGNRLWNIILPPLNKNSHFREEYKKRIKPYMIKPFQRYLGD